MPEFDLDHIDGLVDRMRDDVEGFHLDERRHRLRATLRELQRLSPVDSGEHRASWTPWGLGGPGVSRARAQGHTTPLGANAADAAVEGLPLGADFGVASSDPAGPRLVSGLSKKARPHYPQQAIRRALRHSHRLAGSKS